MATQGTGTLGARAELRRGWRILVGATLGVAVGSASLPFYSAGVFVTPLGDAFGWTRSQFAAVSFLATMAVVLCAPLAGLAVDRFGVRLPAAFSLLMVALGFSALSMGGADVLYFGAVQVALFGLGVASTPISFTRAINETFASARGLALGITLSGTGIAATFAPVVLAEIIAAHGWRTAYRALALVVLVALPVVILLLGRRGRHERVAAPASVPAPPPPPPSSPSHAAAEPLGVHLRDPRMWRLLVTFFFLALGVAGFVLHLVPMLTDRGMSQIEAAAIQGRLGIAVIVGRLVIGVAVDHFFAPRIAALSLCLTVAGIAALAFWGVSVAPWSAFAIGFALGAEVDLIGYLTARYFGMHAYGRLYAVLYGAFVLGTGLSPLLIAEVVRRSGGYQPALWACAAFVGFAVLLLATAPRFRPTPGEAGPAAA